MRKLITIGAFIGLSIFGACRQNPENGGEEIRGNEQRSDTPMDMGTDMNQGSDTTGTGNNSPQSDSGNSNNIRP